MFIACHMHNLYLSENQWPYLYSVVYWVVVMVQAIFYIEEGGDGAFFRILLMALNTAIVSVIDKSPLVIKICMKKKNIL